MNIHRHTMVQDIIKIDEKKIVEKYSQRLMSCRKKKIQRVFLHKTKNCLAIIPTVWIDNNIHHFPIKYENNFVKQNILFVKKYTTIKENKVVILCFFSLPESNKKHRATLEIYVKNSLQCMQILKKKIISLFNVHLF